MDKDAGREVSIHLTLGDSDFADQFNKVIGGLTDQLNQSGKQFASHMASAEKSIRQSTEALSDTISDEPGRQARSKGPSAGPGRGVKNAEGSMARANKLMQQMEKRSIDASEGAMRMGTEYEEVQKVVNDLVTATEKLKDGSRVTHDLKAQNRLRKQAGKTINQLTKKIKELARTEQISREQAERMLGDLRDGAARYSDERIKAEKAIQSVQRKSMTEFRRQMKSRIALVDALPEKHDRIRDQLEAERKTLVQKVEANEDNIQAIERLAEVKKTIGKLDKQEQKRRQAQAKLRQERETQKAAGSEMAFGVNMKQQKKRVKQELDEMRQIIASRNPFEALKDSFGAGDSLKKQKGELEEIFRLMDKEGEEAAKGLKQAQQQKLAMLDEEIDRLIQRDQIGEATEQEQIRLNELEEQRLRTLKNIENTEEQIKREKAGQTARQQGQGAGRKAVRRRMRQDGSFAQYNASLQMSRLVQDAPFGLMGMMNNIDMAVDSMQKLRKQTESTGQAMKKLFFGSTASTMLWINALTAATLILSRHVDIAGRFEQQWEDTKAAIFGAGDAMENLKEQIDEATKSNLVIMDNISAEKAKGTLEDVTQKLHDLRMERREYVKGPEVLGGPNIPGTETWGVGGIKQYLFPDEDMQEFNEQISEMEQYEEQLGEFVAEGFGMKEAYERSAEFGVLTVKEHAKVLDEIQSHQSEMADIMLRGRDGEEAIPYKKDKIRARYEEETREIEALMQKRAKQLRAARDANAEEEAKRLQKNLLLLTDKLGGLPAARERELANVGEDGSGDDDPADGLRELIDMRHEVKRREIEISEEGLEEKKQIIDHELKVQKVALDRRLEDFEGTVTQEAEFAELIAERKAQAEEQAERDKTDAVEEHARKRRQIRMENAQVELDLQKKRLSLQDDTNRTAIERSRLQMKSKVLSMNEKIAKAEDEGYTERAENLRKIRDLQSRVHDQRVADIRAQTQERARQMEEEINSMVDGAERYSQRIATFQTGMYRGAIQGEVERIQMGREEAIRSARDEFGSRMSEIDEMEKQAEDTYANEQKFYQQRLALYEWFREEKEAIREDYDDQEEQAIKESQRAFASMVGGQLSSRLSDVSSGLNDLQRVFVANRKKHLMEQGVAEEEAAARAEEAGRRRFAIKKKIAIAEATVNTFNAAMNAYNQASQFGGLAGGIAAFTTALTFGFAQVAKIRAMGIESAGKSGGGVDASGLGSGTDATGSQVTDPNSSFAPSGAGMSTSGKRQSAQQDSVEGQIKGLRGDMERHTAAIENMKPEATMSDDTAIEAGEKYSDHKSEDTY